MTEKLSVCFIWHMHQPLYKDRLSGKYLMPWVRLHAIKDYLDMPLILEKYPKIRQTFNMVPSLLDQLDDYAKGAVDEQLILTEKDEKTYTDKDKETILSESFHCNFDRQVKPNAPYFKLWEKRQSLLKEGLTYSTMINKFTPQEYADMATWMNLVWFDPYWVEQKKEVTELISQGSNFTRKQRQRMIEIEREIISETIPIYKRLQDAGHIEVTTTPYYHPILPLLIDTNAARWAVPTMPLPEKQYFHREDAKAQLDRGLKMYERMLGRKAKGMWPSEMSVSPAALELIAQCGIKWVVLDEALLTKTTGKSIYRDDYGNLNSPELLCQPYKLRVGDEEINLIFREVVTSNEIGFNFGARDAKECAENFHQRLKHIQQRTKDWSREAMVAVALDGENCWETYVQDGHPFLKELYERLSADPTLNICTVSEYLDRNPPTETLHNIHSGSWISADYHIWIGDPHKNIAWDLLGDTRNWMIEQFKHKKFSDEVVAAAWEEIYTAEGSDWFWWFGEPNNSAHDLMFDEQFRLHLQNVYKLLGAQYPEILDVSIYEQVATKKAALEAEREAEVPVSS